MESLVSTPKSSASAVCATLIDYRMEPEIRSKEEGACKTGSFLFSAYPDGSPVTFSSSGHIALVFVLEGCVVFDFPFQKQILREGNLMAVDKRLMNDCSCEKGTTLMEYTPSEKFIRYLDLCKNAFRKSHSSIVPILTPVKEWINALLKILARGEEYSEDFWQTKRKELAFLLMNYPKDQLGEMYAALYACYKKR